MLRITYHYFILFILFLLPTLCFGQAVYEGQVIDKETERAIPSVTVTLVKAKFVTKTNERGYFKLSADNPVDGDALQFSSEL
ncbi:hypothetical protein HK413_12060 [Mucilaginibacter sp. S1162]|uniref:Carboxypeptidase-like regulatory domain-containing protein n=1 Tax=Mucilaginibacter humi TaxID=2732510 RepID=A0ABX1W4S1_9SPHI|nr:hypothetical protein [Mucilaginibacter humi]